MKSHDLAATRMTRATTIVFVGFAGVALFYLVTEHRAHLFGALPLLLLLSCLLMHLFMHGKHGHEGHSGGTTTDGDGAETPRARPVVISHQTPGTVEEKPK